MGRLSSPKVEMMEIVSSEMSADLSVFRNELGHGKTSPGIPRRQFLKTLLVVPFWLRLQMSGLSVVRVPKLAYGQGRYGEGPYGSKTD
jgi:hypothetical protein